jgi:hypothetical protein
MPRAGEKGSKAMRRMANIFKWFKDVLKGPFIADVPLELLQCEFECRVGQCNYGKWPTSKLIWANGWPSSHRRRISPRRQA